MDELFELAVKVTREEIPDDFEDFRRFLMETDDGNLLVVNRSEYMKARKGAKRFGQTGLKAGQKK